jgi:glucoamylase
MMPNESEPPTAATDHAPGAPGSSPTWTSSAKDAVGCTLGPARLWFTLGYGIVNEIYWPRVDLPQIRDLGFIVSDGRGFWVEVKRLGNHTLRALGPGAPAFEVVHSHPEFSLRLRITPDPQRDVLVVQIQLEGDPKLRVYALLAPHLGGTGLGNRAGVGQHRSRQLVWAEQGPFAVALCAVTEQQRDAVLRASVGYVGGSDGWQDFAANGAMTWTHRAAGPGNVAMMVELPPRCVLAVGFSSGWQSAATLAVSSLLQPFDRVLAHQLADWDVWQCKRCEHCGMPLDAIAPLQEQLVISSTVLRSHLDKTYPGAMVASLSIPWGDSGRERSGYHLVWPRDLVQCAGALLVLGAHSEARETLRYLVATQNADGHWHQNQWLGGMPEWKGIQLDETAFPVLLAAALAEHGALDGVEVADMVRTALGFIACHGPASDQDRWEENAGLNAFTLATCIAALVAGGTFLSETAARWAADLADFWNANLERWMVAQDTSIDREAGVAGHYVRTAPHRVLMDAAAFDDLVPIRNRAGFASPAAHQVSTDFLQLVRYGLRSADDRLIRDSLIVVDRLLKVVTPAGPAWRRYNGDGYGEYEDGRPYDGAGCGRPWPLLTGERGHYELIAGRDPLPYLEAMAAMASPGGMLPEQVWDQTPIAERRLLPGRPTGAAMPLAWAHAEFAKLWFSRHLGRPVDRPAAVWKRYKGRPLPACRAFWWEHAQISRFPSGALLTVATPRPAVIRWGIDGWQQVTEVAAEDTGLGFFAATLATQPLLPGQRADFTIRWLDDGHWIGRDWKIFVCSPVPVAEVSEGMPIRTTS